MNRKEKERRAFGFPKAAWTSAKATIVFYSEHMRASKNRGTRKSSIYRWIFYYKPSSYWGFPIPGNPNPWNPSRHGQSHPCGRLVSRRLAEVGSPCHSLCRCLDEGVPPGRRHDESLGSLGYLGCWRLQGDEDWCLRPLDFTIRARNARIHSLPLGLEMLESIRFFVKLLMV